MKYIGDRIAREIVGRQIEKRSIERGHAKAVLVLNVTVSSAKPPTGSIHSSMTPKNALSVSLGRQKVEKRAQCFAPKKKNAPVYEAFTGADERI